MSLEIKKSMTISGTSMVEMTANGVTQTVQAAYMNASIGEKGEVNINKSIINKEAYEAHKKEVRTDFTNFETAVYEAIDGGQE